MKRKLSPFRQAVDALVLQMWTYLRLAITMEVATLYVQGFAPSIHRTEVRCALFHLKGFDLYDVGHQIFERPDIFLALLKGVQVTPLAYNRTLPTIRTTLP